MEPRETILSLSLAFLFLLSGCLHALEDPGGTLPLEVANGLAEPVEATLTVREPYGDSILYESRIVIAPGAKERTTTPRLPFGTYVLSASDGRLEREVEADFVPSTQFQRFVLHRDVIAFQSG